MTKRNEIDQIHYLADVQTQSGFASVWSAPEMFDDVTEEHPFGAFSHILYRENWDDVEVRVPLVGNTFKHLWKVCDVAIRQSGDLHHQFIEALRVNKDGELELHTGS